MILNIAIKPLWIVIDNRVHDIVGKGVFGRYAALVSLVSLLSVFYDLGISHFSSQSISKDNSNFNKLFPSLLVLRLSVLVVLPFVILGIGFLLGYEGEDLRWLFMIAIAHNLFQCALFFRAKLQAFQRFKLDSVASVAQRLIMVLVIAGITLGFSGWFNDALAGLEAANSTSTLVDWYILIEVGTHLMVFVLLFAVVVWLFGWVKFEFDRASVGKVIMGSLPFAVMTLLYSVNAHFDVLMLDQLHSSEETGLYKGAVRLYESGMMYPWVLMPMFFAKFASIQGDKQKAQNLIRVGTLVMFLPMVILGLVFIFAPEPLFVLYFKHATTDVDTMQMLLGVLGFSFIIHGFSVVFGTFLNASGYVKNVNWMVAISVLSNVVLNWIFIPKQGAVAAAWTTALSTVILFLAYLYLLKFKAKMSANFSLLGRMAIITGLTGTLMYFLSDFNLWWIYNWIIIGSTVGVLALVLGFFKKSLYVLEE